MEIPQRARDIMTYAQQVGLTDAAPIIVAVELRRLADKCQDCFVLYDRADELDPMGHDE